MNRPENALSRGPRPGPVPDDPAARGGGAPFRGRACRRARSAPSRLRSASALGRVLAADVAARRSTCRPSTARPSTASPCARPTSRAASEAAPVTLQLNDEVIACGVAPQAARVAPGTATPIATGGPIPRGADAVVMIEQTDPVDGRTAPRSPSAARPRRGNSSPSPAPTSPAARRCCGVGTVIGSREIGMLAACGIADVSACSASRASACSRPATNSWQPGEPLPAGGDLRRQRPDRSARRLRRTAASRSSMAPFPDERGGARLPPSAQAFAECDMRHPVRRHVEGRRRSDLPPRRASRRSPASSRTALR